MNKIQTVIILTITIIFCSININAADLTVTKSTNSNDGVCDADCSLREAVAVSNSGDRIIFNSNLVGQTFTLGGSFLSIPAGKTIEIDGNLDGTNVVFLSNSNTASHFFINENATVSLKNIVLTEGRGQAGSILCASCNLSLDRVSIRNNRGGNFAAIGFFANGNFLNTIIITNSSITNNTTLGGVGSIISVNPSSTLYMSNTTVSGNRIEEDDGFSYGGIYIAGNAFIRNCTIANNTTTGRGGGIVLAANGILDIGNTIVAKNTAVLEGQDMYLFGNNGQIISRGGNLIGDIGTIPVAIFSQTNDAINVNPLLAPSNSNQGGHPIFTHPLQAGSPAINKGVNSVAVEPFSNTALTNDERGADFPRIAGNTVDKGAFEDQSNGSSLVVSKLTDGNDNVCDTDCSLREAVYAAGQDSGTDNITMAANVFGTMSMFPSMGEIVIQNQNVNIIGYPNLSAATLVISGGNANRIFRLANANVTFTGLTMANGNGKGENPGFGGGALLAVGGTLTLDRVIVRNNNDTSFGPAGGGISVAGGRQVRIMNSTFNANSAPQAFAVYIDSLATYITNTTIANNSGSAEQADGALNVNGMFYMRNSTIAGNRASNSTTGAGLNCFGTSICSVGNSILADNLAANGADLSAGSSLTSVGGNLVENNTGFPNANLMQLNDVIGIDPMLMSLADNGGNVPTMMLNPPSPAINSGVNSSATDPLNGNALTTDARGFTRINGGIIDKGAFESSAPTAAPVSISGRVTDGKRGVARARVEMIDQQGLTRTAITNSFGYFRFEEVEVGASYIFNISAKSYAFPTQVISVTQQISDLNFVGAARWETESAMPNEK